MKNLLKLLPFFVLFLSTSAIYGQGFEVPKNYKLNTPADYEAYEETVLAGIQWLNKTPMDQYYEKRIEASKFLTDWIMGNPKFKVGTDPRVINFTEKNPILMTVYLGGYTKYALQNLEELDDQKAYMAGIKAAIKFYEKMQGLEPDENLEELRTINKRGELKKHISAQLKS